MSDCTCHADGFCQRYQREMIGRSREICQGINIDPEKAAGYRANWTRISAQSVHRQKECGDHLKEILAKYNAKPHDGCGCEDMVRQMNEWGVEGCCANRQTIIDKLQENAKTLGWWETVAIGAALMQEPWFNPLDRFGSLVDEAIRRAESQRQLAIAHTGESQT